MAEAMDTGNIPIVDVQQGDLNPLRPSRQSLL